MDSDFKYLKTKCKNMHDVVTLVKSLKTQDEGQLFLTAFRKHIQDRIGPVADTSLSRFLQRNYPEESTTIHEFLKLSLWEEPNREPTQESSGKKGGKRVYRRKAMTDVTASN